MHAGAIQQPLHSRHLQPALQARHNTRNKHKCPRLTTHHTHNKAPHLSVPTATAATSLLCWCDSRLTQHLEKVVTRRNLVGVCVVCMRMCCVYAYADVVHEKQPKTTTVVVTTVGTVQRSCMAGRNSAAWTRTTDTCACKKVLMHMLKRHNEAQQK